MESTQNITNNYLEEIKKAKDIKGIREIEHKMFDNDNLSDTEMDYIFHNGIAPKIKQDFQIDLIDIAEKLEISLYELILKIF